MASALEMLSSIVPQREVPATQAVNPMGEGLAAQADPNIVAERMKSYEMLQGVDPNPVRMPLSPLGALEQQHNGDAVAMLKSATQQMTQNAPPENVYEFVRKQAMAAAAQKDTKLQAKHRDRVKDVLKESMPGVDVEQIPFDHMVRLAAEGGQLADPFAVGFFKPQDEETKQMYDLAAEIVKPYGSERMPAMLADPAGTQGKMAEFYKSATPEQRQKFLEVLGGVSASTVGSVQDRKLSQAFLRGFSEMIENLGATAADMFSSDQEMADFLEYTLRARNTVRAANAIEPGSTGALGVVERGIQQTAQMAPSVLTALALTPPVPGGAAAPAKALGWGAKAKKAAAIAIPRAPGATFWAANTRPQLKADLIDSGLSEEQANGLATAGSAVIGAIEQFVPDFGIKGPKLTGTTGLERRIAEWMVKSGINFGKEWSEEALQAAAELAVKGVAAEMGGKIDWETEGDKAIDQIVESAIPLMVMQGPGTAGKGIQQFRKGLQDPARWASADLMRTLTPEQRKGLRSDDAQTRARAFWQLPRDVREALFSTDVNQRGQVADKYSAEADEMREQKQPITPPRGPMSADTDELLQKDLQKEKAWIPTPEEISRAVDDARKAPTFSEEDVNVPSDKMTETERIPASPEQAAKSREAIRNRLRSIGDKRTAAAMEEYMARQRPPESEPESVAEPEQQTTEPPVERPKLGDKMQQQAERRKRRQQKQKEAGVVAPTLEEKQAAEQKRREDAEALALRSVQGEDVQKPEDMSQQGWNALKRQQAKKAGVAPRSIGDKADVVSEEQVRVSDKTEEAPATSDKEFGESIAAEREKVIGQLMATGLQRADAEDAFGNATLEVLKNRSKVDPEKPIGALLLDVAKKRAKDSFRKRRREKQASDVVEPVAQAEMPPAENYSDANIDAMGYEEASGLWRTMAPKQANLPDGIKAIREDLKARVAAKLAEIPTEKPKKKGPVQKNAEQKQPWEMSLTEFVPEEKIDDQAVFDEHRKSVMDAIERGDIESHPDYPETVRKAVQDSAEGPAQVLGDMSKKKSVSGADIGRLLAAQKNNVDARAEGVAGRDAESLADRWVASDEFVLMDIPVGMARPATAPEGPASVTPDMPIVVDRNKTGAGRVHGKFGAPADIIIIDGKHRHATAENSGQATIKAWVGKEAVPLIEKAQQPTIGKKAPAESVGTSKKAPTKPKRARKKGPVQRKDWKPSVVEAVKGTEKTIPEVFEDAKRANPSLTLDEFKSELEQMHERGEVQLKEYTLAPANITEEDGITLKKEAIEHKGGDPYWFVRESPQWWKDRTADRAAEKPDEPPKKKGPVQKKAVPVQGTDAQDVQRIADKLVAWKGTERLTDPENFRSSWTEYDVDKQKAIVKELVDRGELPVSFSRMREKKNRAYLTATELLDGLTRNYANDKYKKPKASDAKREAFKKAGQAFVDGFGMKVDGDKAPDRVKLAADLLFAAIDLGITQFSEFITEFVKDNGRDTAIRLASELQAAWTTARKFYPSKKLGEVGSVADILAEESPKPEKPAEPPKPPKEEPEPPPIVGKSTGIKNRKSDEMRKDMGLPPLPGVPTMTREAMVEDAKAAIAADHELPSRIVGELLNKPRGLSWRETTILNLYLRDLSNSIYRLSAERDKAMQEGDEQKLNTTVDAIETAEDNINRVLLVGGRGYAGTEWSLSGNARQIELMPDMTLNRMLKDAKNAKGPGKNVTAAEAAKYAQMAAEIERLRARNEELERDAAERVYNNQIDKDIEEQSGGKARRRTKKDVANQRVKDAAAKVAEGLGKLVLRRAAKGRAFASFDDELQARQQLLDDSIELAKALVDAGVKTMAEFFGKLKDMLSKETFDEGRPIFKEAWQMSVKDGDIAGPEIDTTSLASISKAARKIEKEVIRQGLDEGRLVPGKIKAEHRQYVLDAVREEMDIYMPGITERQVKEALSGYGIYVQLSKSDMLAIQRDLHGQFRQLSKLDDMAEKKLPKVSGREMPEPTEEERRLILKVNDGLRNNELIPQDGSRLQKSALESAKRALLNRMNDMREEMDANDQKFRKKREFETDEEYENMRKEFEALKALYNEQFPKLVTEEQKIKAVLNGLERAIKNLSEMIARHDLLPHGKDPVTSPEIEAARARLDVLRAKRDELRKNDPEYQAMLEDRREKAKENSLQRQINLIQKALDEHKLMPEAKRDPATNDAIKEKEAQLKKLRKDLEEARENDPEYQAMIEERRRAAYKSLIAERLERMLLRQQEESDVLAEIQRNKPSLRKRLFESKQERKERKEKRKQLFEKAGVQFKPKEKKERVIDDETLDNLWRIEQLNKEHRKNLERWRQESLTGKGKWLDKAWQTILFSRAIKTSLDWSAILRQGAFTSYAHPILTLKNIPATWKATLNPKAAFRIREEIKQRDNYRLYLKSGLAITELDGHITSQEEVFAGRWAGQTPLVASSERAYVTFLNLVRADVFDAMIAGLSRRGTPTKEEAEWTAFVVNMFTGRGSLGKKADAGLAYASAVMFAPRYMISRFQLATMPLWGGLALPSKQMRMAVAKEYARALFGVGALYALAYMASAAMGDDDEDAPTIEWDWRSGDWGKIRIGAQRIDVLGGLSQVVSYSGKTIMGEQKTLAGTIAPLRGDDVKVGSMDWDDVQWRFLQSKAAPIVGMMLDIGRQEDFMGKPHEIPGIGMLSFDGQKAVRDTMGEKAYMLVAIGVNQFVPLTMSDMAEAFDELSIPRAMGAVMMNFVGMQNSVYEEADYGQYRAEMARVRTEKSQNENPANIRLHKSQGLMEKLKELEKEYKEAGKDTWEIRTYMNGAARWALGKTEAPRWPNPFTATNLPADVKAAVKEHLATVAVTASGLPEEWKAKPESVAQMRSAVTYLRELGLKTKDLFQDLDRTLYEKHNVKTQEARNARGNKLAERLDN